MLPGENGLKCNSRTDAAGGSAAGLVHADDLAPLWDESARIADHPTAPHGPDGAVYEYVTVASAASPRERLTNWSVGQRLS